MLDNAVADFLGAVTEREFDEPLLALLRARGFDDIHFLHGPAEFGKDVIARADVGGTRTQFVIQSKAGDLNLAGWNGVAGQLDLLRNDRHAHPSFDPNLPRQAVLVLTGRLIGNAPLAAQDYAQRAVESGQTPLEVWDRERLIELLVGLPDAVLAGSAGGPLFGLLAAIDDATVTEDHLERFSRYWLRVGEIPEPRSAIEASIVGARLANSGRKDLAAITALCLLRAVWASVHGAEPVPLAALEMADSARRSFVAYAEEIQADAEAPGIADDDLAGLNASGGYYSTYRVMALRLLEILGLLALADDERRDAIADWMARFIEANPGASQPLSDRWAVSLIPSAVLLASHGPEKAAQMLGWVVAWLCDHYEDDRLGLAGADADPTTEVDYFFGDRLEHVDERRRLTSYLATVTLDLTAALELADLYGDVINDFFACDIAPGVPLPRDDDSQYQITRGDIHIDTSPIYASEWSAGDDWRMAPHHDDDLSRYYLGRIGRIWDFVAICSVTRDRHWPAAIRALATKIPT